MFLYQTSCCTPTEVVNHGREGCRPSWKTCVKRSEVWTFPLIYRFSNELQLEECIVFEQSGLRCLRVGFIIHCWASLPWVWTANGVILIWCMLFVVDLAFKRLIHFFVVVKTSKEAVNGEKIMLGDVCLHPVFFILLVIVTIHVFKDRCRCLSELLSLKCDSLKHSFYSSMRSFTWLPQFWIFFPFSTPASLCCSTSSYLYSIFGLFFLYSLLFFPLLFVFIFLHHLSLPPCSAMLSSADPQTSH